jgi:hypothetical protein
MTEQRIKLDKTVHLFEMGFASGMLETVDLLNKLPASCRNMPGVQLAIATISAQANGRQANLIGKNLAVISKAGHPVEDFKTISFDPHTSELVCEFYEPDLLGGEG